MILRPLFFLLTATALHAVAASDLVYRFPTSNHKLLEGDNEGFYMYCDRTFEGATSKPWQAGSYGFVRNPFRNSEGELMFSRLHEGIDIKPLQRTADGTPLDEVRPVAPGKVVHVSAQPGLSNYGRYVVLEHDLPEGKFYSLYAHLAAIACELGQFLGTGNTLGTLGYSGKGLNKTRAHCHVEFCYLVNSHYADFAPQNNKHGNFNGLNLVGMDISPLLVQCKDGEPISLQKHIASLPEHYRIRVPYKAPVDLLERHPFLYKGSPQDKPKSLDFAFTAEGVPVAVYPANEELAEPKVVSCKPMPTLQQNCTMNRLKNSSSTAALTASGKRYVANFLWSPSGNTDKGQKEEE